MSPDSESQSRPDVVQEILDASGVGTFVLDDSFEVVWVNDAIEEYFGVDRADLIGADKRRVITDTISDVFEQPERFSETVLATYDDNTYTERFECHVLPGADRQERWLEHRSRPIESGVYAGGRIEHYLDITERKRLETGHQAEKKRFEQLLEASPVAITILDTDGTIVRANSRAETVFDLSHSTITDRVYDDHEWEIVDEDGDPLPPEELPFARVMDTGDPVFDHQHGIKWPDGTERWLSINAAPIPDDDGEIEQVIAIIMDTTDQRHYQREIEQTNERLETFASVVSHDLRNPLNVAEGRLQLAREANDNEHLEAVDRAHDRMRGLIEDLLTLARSGTDVDDDSPVDLAELLEACWANVETADATLVVEIDRTIRADEGRLKQVFENLFRNSVEHGGEGVTVTVGELDDGFYVADDGPGIPESERADVFEAGYSTTTDGTGFGLNIVREIVTAHDWDIRVTDSEAGGARFEITGVQFVA